MKFTWERSDLKEGKRVRLVTERQGQADRMIVRRTDFLNSTEGKDWALVNVGSGWLHELRTADEMVKYLNANEFAPAEFIECA